MAEDVRARLAELDELLKAGIRDQPVVTFASLRRTDTYPPFDPGQLGEPLPPPLWEEFAPAPPSGIGKIFGGTGRFERQLDSARADLRSGRRAAHGRRGRPAPATGSPARRLRCGRRRVRRRRRRAQCRHRPVPAGLPGRGPRSCRRVLHPRHGLIAVPGGIPAPHTRCVPARSEGSRHRVGTATTVGDPAGPGLPVRGHPGRHRCPSPRREGDQGTLPGGDRSGGTAHHP